MAPFNIVVIGGDRSGPEVVAKAVKVLKAIESNSSSSVQFNLQDHLLGDGSINAHGKPLTDAALEAAKSADAVLLGAIGGPRMGHGRSTSGARDPTSAQGVGHIREPAAVLLPGAPR